MDKWNFNPLHLNTSLSENVDANQIRSKNFFMCDKRMPQLIAEMLGKDFLAYCCVCDHEASSPEMSLGQDNVFGYMKLLLPLLQVLVFYSFY